jgi:hypothetical protein
VHLIEHCKINEETNGQRADRRILLLLVYMVFCNRIKLQEHVLQAIWSKKYPMFGIIQVLLRLLPQQFESLQCWCY